MTAPRSRQVAGLRLILLDDPGDADGVEPGQVVVCGAPATLRSARALLRHAPALVVLHDAGVGRDAAGIAGLERLDDLHVPAVAVGHDSARVGDADDVLDRGRIAHLNDAARAAGLEPGPLAAQLTGYAERSARRTSRDASAGARDGS